MAASCTSSRPVSFFSRVASFLARSGLAKSDSRILAKARTTKMLTRALPRRSVASPCDQCSPSNGGPARRIHLHCLWAIQNVRGHQSAVFCEYVRTIFPMPAAAGFLSIANCDLKDAFSSARQLEHKVCWESLFVAFYGFVKARS